MTHSYDYWMCDESWKTGTRIDLEDEVKTIKAAACSPRVQLIHTVPPKSNYKSPSGLLSKMLSWCLYLQTSSPLVFIAFAYPPRSHALNWLTHCLCSRVQGRRENRISSKGTFPKIPTVRTAVHCGRDVSKLNI